MIYPVIIVGGGFAGLTLANLLESRKKRYLLIEKNDRLGKKILATGNGRGNVTNLNLDLSHYHGSQKEFPSYAIKNYDNRLIADFFEEKGVLLTNENDKVYPSSKQANAILDAMRFGVDEKNLLLNSEVTDIKKNSDGNFTVCANGKTYSSEKIVLCVGGKAAPHFGTDGSSYGLAENLGHKITKLYPSLVQLTVDKKDVKGLKGVKEAAVVKGYSGDKLLKITEGDILFTDNGVSGNTVFFLSSYLTDAKNPYITIDFLPSVEKEAAINVLMKRRAAFPTLSAETFLSGLTHSRISYKITSDYFGKNLSELSYKDIKDSAVEELVYALKNYKIVITGNVGFNNAQVTRGGVSTFSVESTTMESKICKGLYFAGEVLDVDGDCGGYNLQWAFSSAKCVYRSIIEEK